LEIIAESNDEAHSTGLGFFVRAGARDETDRLAGVSHFLEHMVFKGTPRRTADDVNREFDEMGAHYNAFTSEENTVYYAAVLPECQERCVELLADIMRPSLREDDFNMEKQVIIEEISMYEDQPPFGADDKIKELHFAGHPLARSVLGTEGTISDLSVEEMRGYFRQRYSPNNILLAAAGKLDFDRLVKQAEQICGAWETREVGRETPRAAGRSGFHVLPRENATQQYVLQLADAPAATDDDRYAAKVLATVVGDDSGSRLYWDLIDTGRAEHASLSHYEYEGTGVTMTYMSCVPNQTTENLQRMLDIFREVEREGVTAQELAQAKSKWKSRLVLGGERPRNRLFAVGGNWMQRKEYRHVRDDLAAIEAVTLDDVRAVLAKYPLSVGTTVAIGPLKELAAPT
jgi:predicted Zn-dependent peptidase